jgi:hypothetical protein
MNIGCRVEPVREICACRQMDAFIIFLLVMQASMIFPALNWSPVRWFRGLSETSRFSFFVVIFAAVTSFATWVQVWAFIQSERAFLVVSNLQFRTAELTYGEPLELLIEITNPGKSVASFREVNISSLAASAGCKELRETKAPKYIKMAEPICLPSIAPGDKVVLRAKDTNTYTPEDVNNFKSGKISFCVFGFIKYYDGYNLFNPSQIGYCFKYVPPSERYLNIFEGCGIQQYVYAR